MTNLFERLARALGILLLLALCACGPGSGGTGTGPTSVSFGGISATPATVTSAGGGTVADTPGCGAACVNLDLQVSDVRVELTVGCSRFVFTGEWALGTDRVAVLPGRLESLSGASFVPAMLRLEFSGDVFASELVSITLVNESGATLVGPTTLARRPSTDTPVVTGTCPP